MKGDEEMGKVYRHRPGTLDEYLGRVEPKNGKVYRHRAGPDEYVGRVELDSGKVYRHLPGPDEYLGQVHLEDGKVYSHRVGPDRYVAEVRPNGRVYGHQPVALDDYLGRVEGMHSLAEGGAAFLLLLLPGVEREGAEGIEGDVDED
jgi:hypothetical protein